MRFLRILLAVVGLSLIAASASASLSDPKDGEEYLTLQEAQPTDSGDKVEVMEFFSYGCPHCNALDPSLSAWVKQEGDRIVFKRVPVGFHSSWIPLQKLYYSLEAMGKLEEMHPKIFKAIHEQRMELDSDATVADFVAKQGIDKAKFLDFYNSFGIQTRVRRAAQLQQDYKIDSVPTVVIGGKYVTSPSIVGKPLGNQPESVLHAAMVQVANVLVDRLAKKSQPKPQAAKATKPAAKPAKRKAAH